MRILFLAVTLEKGGAERVINVLANELSKENEVKIISSIKGPIGYHFNKDVSIDCLSKKNELRSTFSHILGRISILKFKKLYQGVKKYDPDIIIAFLPGASFRILLLKKLLKNKLKSPIIISERNDPNIEYKNPLSKTIMKLLYKYANGFVFQTNDAKNYFNGIINCKTRIILNPLDKSFMNRPKSKNRKKEIVTVGRLAEQKNHKLLLSAFKEALINHPDYTLKIYGEGPLKSDLVNFVQTNNLAKHVQFMGHSSDIAEQIKDSALFVLSSDYEGMPNALAEAMALGIPCISTDCPCGGPRMLIDNSFNGILVPVNDRSALSKNINTILSNHDHAEKLAENAQKVTKRLNKQNITEEWISFIEEVRLT